LAHFLQYTFTKNLIFEERRAFTKFRHRTDYMHGYQQRQLSILLQYISGTIYTPRVYGLSVDKLFDTPNLILQIL